MVTRETRVYAVFIVSAAIATIAMNGIFPDLFDGPGGAAVGLIAFYGVGVGGAHLYLFFRSDDEEVPRSARARLLLAIAVAFPVFAAGAFLEGEGVVTLDVSLLLGILGGLVFVGYFVNEMRHGYADSAEETGLR